MESGHNKAVITTSLPLAPDVANHHTGEMAPAVITTVPPPLASPGKAVNGRGTVHSHEDSIQEVQAKRQNQVLPLINLSANSGCQTCWT
jgi:hypothetical protein